MPELHEISMQFEHALLSLDRLAAQKILHQISDANAGLSLIDAVVVPALEHIGDQWERGDMALSQVYMSGRICEEVINLFLPSRVMSVQTHPLLALAVLEDYHLLGKRIVSSALKSAGFTFLDYGQITASELVNRVCSDRVQILLLSVLMLRSALRIENVRAQLKQRGLQVIIIVGGAPFRFDPQLWQEVGADAMGRSALDAPKIVRRYI